MVWPLAQPHQKAPYGMTKEIWKQRKCCFGKFYGYVLEKTNGGQRIENKANHGRATIDSIHFDAVGIDFVFANCRNCLSQKFTGDYKTGVDPGVDIKDPNTARFGRCGCVCCTECVLQMRQEGSWIGCPACGCKNAQHKNEIFWIVNQESLSRM
jgi:hypothetical protein